MINLIAHRGLWTTNEEKNSLKALKKALSSNISIETDIRDYDGKIYLSHDPISDYSSLVSLDFLLTLHSSLKSKSKLFLNVKSDGLYNLINNDNTIIKDYSYFFDMSFPEMVQYDRKNFNYLIRLSEFENPKINYFHFNGFWIDSFYNDNWYFESKISLLPDKIYAFVSPELHKQDFSNFWRKLKELKSDLFLCTDYIDKAKEYFHV